MTKGITDIDEGTIRRIDWQELLPVTMLVRAFSMALSPFAICLSALVFAFYFSITGMAKSMLTLSPVTGDAVFPAKHVESVSLFAQFEQALPRGDVSWPILLLFALVFMFLWLVFARSLAVRLASTQRSSFIESFKFATRKFKSVLLAILLPGIAIGLCCLVLKLSLEMNFQGVFFRRANQVLFPLFLAVACFKTFLMILTVCAVPLVISAVATEASDGFDAFSRAISYLTQRPLHFICYVLIALLLGAVGSEILSFAVAFVYSGYVHPFFDGASQSGSWMAFWQCFFFSLILGYAFYFVICTSTAIYFMLRRSVDGTPMDNYHSTDSHKPSRKLQPIVRDAQGAPVTPGPVFDSADESPSDGDGQ
ncbi:MAG: hypothetical protein Q4G59_02735 [Planctomycetia bacterium]|nr:hypothetical protein [Planctomycetia bacterium]